MVQEHPVTHIDDFIDDYRNKEHYARWFFALCRFPAALQGVFRPWTKDYELYCTWRDERWRVVGCSRMGPIWLKSPTVAKPGTQTWDGAFYDIGGADVAECSEWGHKP